MTTPDASTRKTLAKVLAPIAVIIVIVCGVLYAAKSQMPANQQDSLTPGNPAGDSGAGNTPTTPVDVGSTLPDFQLTPIGDTKAAKLSSFHSKITLVNFWATWCEACMEEMPSLVALRDAYQSKGFEVVGINLDQNAAAVVPHALKQFKIDFPIFQDPENKIADYFDVHAIPLSAVLAADRKILYIENGERNWNDRETRQMLDKWLSGQTRDTQSAQNTPE
jgi:thiol-disulfide isomerase/thioredoxin